MKAVERGSPCRRGEHPVPAALRTSILLVVYVSHAAHQICEGAVVGDHTRRSQQAVLAEGMSTRQADGVAVRVVESPR